MHAPPPQAESLIDATPQTDSPGPNSATIPREGMDEITERVTKRLAQVSMIPKSECLPLCTACSAHPTLHACLLLISQFP